MRNAVGTTWWGIIPSLTTAKVERDDDPRLDSAQELSLPRCQPCTSRHSLGFANLGWPSQPVHLPPLGRESCLVRPVLKSLLPTLEK